MTGRAEEIRWRGKASNHASAAGLLDAAGDVSLVERGRPRWLVIRCPSGCGETISLNLDRHAGPAWRMYWRGSQLSVHPSVWKESGCESHFIIWRNHIDWLGSRALDAAADQLKADVLRALRAIDFRLYSDVADELDEIPWDVLQACRELVRDGLAVEGEDKQRSSFRLRA